MVQIPKTALYATLSIVLLLVLFVGGGIAYVWYTGQNDPDTVGFDAAPAATKPDPVVTPTKPAANANASASVQMLSTPAAPGENVSMIVKSVPTSICTIKVEYDGVRSNDSGLIAKTADEYGIVDWTWTIGTAVPAGKWPIIVTCIYNERSAVVQGEQVVAR